MGPHFLLFLSIYVLYCNASYIYPVSCFVKIKLFPICFIVSIILMSGIVIFRCRYLPSWPEWLVKWLFFLKVCSCAVGIQWQMTVIHCIVIISNVILFVARILTVHVALYRGVALSKVGCDGQSIGPTVSDSIDRNWLGRLK